MMTLEALIEMIEVQMETMLIFQLLLAFLLTIMGT